MSIMTVCTRITFKYLMSKRKDELAHMVLEQLDLQEAMAINLQEHITEEILDMYQMHDKVHFEYWLKCKLDYAKSQSANASRDR